MVATQTQAGRTTIGGTIGAMVVADGSRAVPHVAALVAPAVSLRDLADAIHTLCALHGMPPSLLDLAIGANGAAPLGSWLAEAAQGFAAERAALVAVTAAIGPLPSTPGQAESQSAIVAQRHALAMLARSDRAGCAIGAALAFAADWVTMHRILAIAGKRVGVDVSPLSLPPLDGIALAAGGAMDRAILFGAQQLLAQHRGLWQLLDARASARGSA